MARQNDFDGNLARKPKVGTTTTRYKYNVKRGGRVLDSNYKTTGISKSLEKTDNLASSPSPNLTPINRLRQNENAPVKDPLNYKQDENSKQSKSGKKQSFSQRIGGFFGRHKKASIGGLAGILVGGTMATFGGLLSGPMSIIHAGEFVGKISDTISDVTSASRMARNISRASSLTKTISNNRQNARVNTASRIMARSYEKTLKKAGIELISDEAGALKHLEIKKGAMSIDDITKAGMELDKITDDGKMIIKFADGAKGAEKSKAFRNTMKIITETSGAAKSTFITKSKLLSSMSARILGKMNLTVGFHPIQKFTAKIMTSNGGKLLTRVKNIDKTLNEFIEKKALALAKRAPGKLVAETAEKVASKAAKGILKTITTGLKASVIGAVFGYALDFVVGLVIERVTSVALEKNLNIAEGKATEIMAMASQIKSGDFPSETDAPSDASDVKLTCDKADKAEDCYEEGTPMDEMDNFVQANLYKELTDNDITEEIDCGLSDDPTDEEIDKCIEESNSGFSSNDDSGKMVSNFWSSAGVKHETGKPANKEDGTVPVELMKDKDSKTEWLKDIRDAALESVIFVSPGMFESDGILSTEDASPIQIGSIATFGAKTASNAKMLASGGNAYKEDSPEAISIENNRKEYIAQEFAEKPLMARLFDVEDYQSAIVTLAHDAGWDTSSQSVSTQLKNVAKTFASLPNLLASSFNKLSYASANTDSDFYGFGTVGYTGEDLAKLPDFDIAGDGIVMDSIYKEIKTDNLEYYGIQSISKDGRVIYKEDTDADKIDVRAKEARPLGSNTKHEVIICNNGDFIWAENNNTCEATQKEVTETIDGKEVTTVISGRTSFTTDQIVRAYLLDYPLIMSAAAEDYTESCDGLEGSEKTECDADINDSSSFISEAMNDMGVSTGSSGSSGSSGGNSEFNSETIQDDFQEAGCKYGAYSVGGNGCTTIPAWFVGEYTTLKYNGGNGGQVASKLASANKISVSKTPVAPAIASTYNKNFASSTKCGGLCGHTWLVIKVEGDTVTMLETYSKLSGQDPCSVIRTYKMSDYSDIEYVNVGEYLK